MPRIDNKETLSLGLSIAVMVLTILAIIFFVIYGGSTLFYITAAAAIVFGFAMAYSISKTPEKNKKPEAVSQPATQKKRSRKKS